MWVDADKTCFTEVGVASSCCHFDGVYGSKILDSLSAADEDLSLLGCHSMFSIF
jgi:hypothetical protein